MAERCSKGECLSLEADCQVETPSTRRKPESPEVVTTAQFVRRALHGLVESGAYRHGHTHRLDGPRRPPAGETAAKTSLPEASERIDGSLEPHSGKTRLTTRRRCQPYRSGIDGAIASQCAWSDRLYWASDWSQSNAVPPVRAKLKRAERPRGRRNAF